jgi:hypothetical protein
MNLALLKRYISQHPFSVTSKLEFEIVSTDIIGDKLYVRCLIGSNGEPRPRILTTAISLAEYNDWLACLLAHKWEYNLENITFLSEITFMPITRSTQVRLCSRCNKKQRRTLFDWVDTHLTVEDRREIKIRKLIQ